MTVRTSAPTKTDWVEVARQLAPDFAARAAEHDAKDTFVAENYAKMRDAKLFSAPLPAELGGGGATYAQHCEIIRTIARACGSTARSTRSAASRSSCAALPTRASSSPASRARASDAGCLRPARAGS